MQLSDGVEISEKEALYISLGIWFILLVAHCSGYDSSVTLGLASVSAYVLGFLSHKLGIKIGAFNGGE